ncbi:serine/threonine protein kinase [Actinomadura barringtoniae]|uniref:non-specific serine/threonine protein kinase n=1 Tax=Actinomadura barringtoniae TaxID=1427535 RepID=A0A939P9Y6_9ACTN|nr:serine/threonine-protein kinase [Actinomadura barringtoniae]MBO2448558.1 serine/threonine protein kinase [Actinomadura barringtoniae]
MGDDLGRMPADRYRIVARIGRGGMGTVWRAEDTDLDRTVAIKELRLPEEVGEEERRLFYARMEREARAAARLKHPGIVTVYDRIKGEDGRPWIVMEYIDGGSLQDLLSAEERLPVRRVAEIGVQMLAALRLAHEHGIVHRDIKPANVLLEGERVVLTDFGIAALEGDVTLTSSGAILGTPAFMAPEQVRGRPATPESDLWALGATLFAAVEGAPPFSGTNPGSVFVAIATENPAPSVHAGPLAEVISGLLRKDPAARLSAGRTQELLAALTAASTPSSAASSAAASTASSESPGATRAEDGRPAQQRPLVQLPPPGPPPPQPNADLAQAGHLQQSMSPRLIGFAAAVAVAVIVLSVFIVRSSGKDHRSAGTDHSPGPRSGSSASATTSPPVREAVRVIHTGTSARTVAFSPDGTTLATNADGGAIGLWNVADGRNTAILKHKATIPPRLAFGQDGGSLLSLDFEGPVRRWDLTTRGSRVAVPAHETVHPAVSRDGTKVARAEGNDVTIWDAATGRKIRTLKGHKKDIGAVVFSPDGKTLAGRSALDNTTRVWDVASGRSLRVLPSPETTVLADELAISPDGKLLARTNDNGTAELWDLATGKKTRTLGTAVSSKLRLYTATVAALTFSPDGTKLATVGGHGDVRLWNVANATPPVVFSGHDGQSLVSGVAFSPDGKLLASASTDETVRLWNVP